MRPDFRITSTRAIRLAFNMHYANVIALFCHPARILTHRFLLPSGRNLYYSLSSPGKGPASPPGDSVKRIAEKHEYKASYNTILLQIATLLAARSHPNTGYELFKRLKSTWQAKLLPCHFLEPSKDCKFVPCFSAILPFNTTAFVMNRAKLLEFGT